MLADICQQEVVASSSRNRERILLRRRKDGICWSSGAVCKFCHDFGVVRGIMCYVMVLGDLGADRE